MTEALFILVVVVVTALAFDFTNGFHDTGNAMATSIATGALKPKVAVALSAVLNLVGGFHALGTLMAVGLMILPAATAQFWARGLGGMMAVAAGTAFAAGAAGLLLSYHASLPSGPAIILVAGIAWLLSLLLGPNGGLLARLVPARHLEA